MEISRRDAVSLRTASTESQPMQFPLVTASYELRPQSLQIFEGVYGEGRPFLFCLKGSSVLLSVSR
jgi:hypothetical protein